MAMCASCHMYLRSDHALPEKSDDEEDMLDEAFHVTDESRLGCQPLGRRPRRPRCGTRPGRLTGRQTRFVYGPRSTWYLPDVTSSNQSCFRYQSTVPANPSSNVTPGFQPNRASRWTRQWRVPHVARPVSRTMSDLEWPGLRPSLASTNSISFWTKSMLRHSFNPPTL